MQLFEIWIWLFWTLIATGVSNTNLEARLNGINVIVGRWIIMVNVSCFMSTIYLICNCYSVFELLTWVIDEVSHVIQFASQMGNHVFQISFWCWINVTCKLPIICFFWFISVHLIVFLDTVAQIPQGALCFVSLQLLEWKYDNSVNFFRFYLEVLSSKCFIFSLTFFSFSLGVGYLPPGQAG